MLLQGAITVGAPADLARRGSSAFNASGLRLAARAEWRCSTSTPSLPPRTMAWVQVPVSQRAVIMLRPTCLAVETDVAARPTACPFWRVYGTTGSTPSSSAAASARARRRCSLGCAPSRALPCARTRPLPSLHLHPSARADQSWPLTLTGPPKAWLETTGKPAARRHRAAPLREHAPPHSVVDCTLLRHGSWILHRPRQNTLQKWWADTQGPTSSIASTPP